jgi:hypothetical protein
MSRDTEKYEYFTVGLLKNSFTLEVLEADARKHHMIENPARLIALRLTEYYDLLARAMPTFPSVPISTTKSPNLNGGSRVHASIQREDWSTDTFENETMPASIDVPENDIVSASADAEQNADEAADYWATL